MSEPAPGVLKHAWPFSKWYPLLAGVLAGLLIRFVFNGKPGGHYETMSIAFVNFAPIAVAAVSVYFSERIARRTWSYYAGIGAGANMLCILGTLLINIEGLICAIIIVPMFGLYGAFGGLMMGAICRTTNWPRPAVFSFAFLPVVLGAILPGGSGDHYIGKAQRSVLIQASPQKIWAQLHNTTNIAPAEVERAWMYRIGVPLPESGLTRITSKGLERDITMGKSIHFTQLASEWRENSYVKWHYRFDEDSIPPGALDDHVKIGGHYFDLIDTEYTITPKGTATELTISMKYRVSTQYNWYTKRVAALLFNNFEDVILTFYARRAERA